MDLRQRVIDALYESGPDNVSRKRAETMADAVLAALGPLSLVVPGAVLVLQAPGPAPDDALAELSGVAREVAAALGMNPDHAFVLIGATLETLTHDDLAALGLQRVAL